MSEPAPAGLPGAVGTAVPVPLRRNRGFRMLWIGQLLSGIGSEMGLIAYPLLILALTRSPVLAGVVGTAREIALICLQLPAGALSDRFDRRLTMIACDAVRAALLAILGILIAVHLASWPVVLVVSLIEGAAGGLFDPSAAAALPSIVAKDQLIAAWAATEGRTWAAGLAGPALGGLLFGLGRAVPFLADAFSYAISFGTVSRIRGRFRPERAPERKALRHEVLDGLRIVGQIPLLRTVVVLGPLVNFAFNGVLFTITVGLRQHGTPATVIGLVQGAIMAGGVLGAPVAPLLQRRLRPSTISLTMILTGTLLFAVAAVVIPSPLVALPVMAVVLLAPAGNSGLFASALRQAPEEMRGRVTSTVTTTAMSLAALAPLLAGLLIEHVSASWAMGAFAAADAIAAVVALAMPGLRDADPPPARGPRMLLPGHAEHIHQKPTEAAPTIWARQDSNGDGIVRLAKVAVEEAYAHPDDAARYLASERDLAQVSDGGGVMPQYYRPIWDQLGEFGPVRLASMAAAGIEHQVISLTAPGVQAITDPAAATAEARRQNDFLAGQVAANPGRFSGFAAVALQEPDNAVKELRRAVGDLGFKGVLVNGYTNDGDREHGRYLDDPAYHRFWETLCELDVPLYLHPRTALPGGLELYAGHPEMKGATWGFGAETAAHAVRLLLSGHFDRFPAAKLILGHLGEGLPALAWRTENMFRLNPFDKKTSKTIPEYFADNIWITTSGNFSDSALINAILTVGADHILFSVDYPYADNAEAADWIERAPISELDRRKIAHGNARALFRLGS